MSRFWPRWVFGLLLASLVSTAAAQGSTIRVPGDFSTISMAVANADSGDRIIVSAEGEPYVEQVVINKDLTLKGKGDPTVKLPSGTMTFTFPESSDVWEPVFFAAGGQLSTGNVTGQGTVRVNISGFTVDGTGTQSVTGDRRAGILERNVRGGIEDNTVKNLITNGDEAFGSVVYGRSDVTISSNVFKNYERGGIFVTGDGGPKPDPTARIVDNKVSVATSANWAPNGIQIGTGAQGEVLGNTVNGNVHPNAASSGIIVLESDNLRVDGNTGKNNDVGVFVGSFFGDESSASNNKVIRNQFTEVNTWGILVATFAPATANNNEVVNNTLEGDDGSIGIWLLGDTARNNKLIHNTISGFDDKIVDGGDQTKVQANTTPANP